MTYNIEESNRILSDDECANMKPLVLNEVLFVISSCVDGFKKK